MAVDNEILSGKNFRLKQVFGSAFLLVRVSRGMEVYHEDRMSMYGLVKPMQFQKKFLFILIHRR